MYDIVLVEWYDAQSGSLGWKSFKEVLDTELALCLTVGYLVKENTINNIPYVVICPHIIVVNNKFEEGDGEIAIPKSWIKTLTVLLEHKENSNG